MDLSDKILQDAYEVIAATILECGKRGVLVNRDQLAAAVLRSHLNDRIVTRSEMPGRDHGKPFEVAANYVDWFSANITEGPERASRWRGRFVRARVFSSHPDNDRLREIWAYSVLDETTRGHFLLKVDPSGRLAVGIIGRDGDWTFGDNIGRLPSGLYTVTFGRWAAVLKELETLINDPACNEHMLQSFFENYPELLKAHEYATVIPEAVIQRDGTANKQKRIWEADFVLAPAHQDEFCKILELKSPLLGSARTAQRGHARFYKELHEAIQQLHDYHDAFYSLRTRELFRGKYGLDVYRPDLHLIIGRRWSPDESAAIMTLQKNNFVKISSWDGELERLSRMFR